MNITNMAVDIMNIWNGSNIQDEYFYSGIRVDIARKLKIAPNNAVFNQAFDFLVWYQSGDGLLYCALPD